MSTPAGPLYELTFSVDPAVLPEFDNWLLELPPRSAEQTGIVDARIFESRNDTDDRRRWTCQFQCVDDKSLDELLEDFFAEAEGAVDLLFGDAVSVSGHVFREEFREELPGVESPDCLNCGARLRGQYCGICGQRARNRLISLWQLISEAFGDLLELDSRLWRTIIPLLSRPGRLTRDYLEGRRARYMPPFRTYLVLSLVFFLVAFFDPRDELQLLFEPEPEPRAEEIAEKTAHAAAAKQKILDELAAGSLVPEGALPAEEADRVRQHIENSVAGDGEGIKIQMGEDGSCDVTAEDLGDAPEWFKKRFTPARLNSVCNRVTEDGGKSFLDLLLDNIPVALIVLLPLMALVLKILYPLSRRYFVEHLLFIVHYHAFFFLILTLQIVFARLANLVRLPEVIAVLAIVAASLYIPLYLYMAMRRVYGQGRILTFMKYIGLVVAYSAGATFTMLGAILFALVAV